MLTHRFQVLDDRDGTEIDVKELVTTFTNLDFEVRVVRNLTASKMETTLTDLSQDLNHRYRIAKLIAVSQKITHL